MFGYYYESGFRGLLATYALEVLPVFAAADKGDLYEDIYRHYRYYAVN